jgi:hypothetical protein
MVKKRPGSGSTAQTVGAVSGADPTRRRRRRRRRRAASS